MKYKGTKDVKQQICLTKIFEAVNSILHGHWYLVHIHVCTISNDIGINKEKEVCLTNNESISGHACERATMIVKYEIFMNHSKAS